MLEQELKDIWNNSSQSGQISIETKQLTEELGAKIKSIQKKIRSRDIREISASIIGILIFGYLLFEIPFPVTKVACGLAIAWFVFVIVKFRKSNLQNTKTDFSLTIAEQLNNQKTMMLQQSNLLDSALYWHAIPPFIMNFIFILGLENPIDYNWTNSVAESLLPFTSNFKIVTLIGLALFYAFTYWINKRALNKDVKPTLESIEKMQQQIKNE
jgi:Ca2+/Na+ antiporter